jgi:hypothetical protein
VELRVLVQVYRIEALDVFHMLLNIQGELSGNIGGGDTDSPTLGR